MSGTVVELDGTTEDDGSLRIIFRVQSDTDSLPDVPTRSLGLKGDEDAFTAFAAMRSFPGTDTALVTDAGQALFDALKRHQNGSVALNQTLHAASSAPNRDIRLLFRNFGQQMRNMPWEVLYDPQNGFLDADHGIPIIRMIKTASKTTRPLPTLSSGELQLVAVLAAEGIDSRPEYDAIRRALKRYKGPWRLKVFTPDPSVSADDDDRIEIGPVPRTVTELMDEIREVRPQICHFLCHGSSVSGGRLEVANAMTAMGGAALKIKPADLGQILPSSAWLVMLNACSSGQADPKSESASLATKLVREGVPVVVGMRQETGMSTLNTFTRTFLGCALDRLDTALKAGVPFDLDLSACLSSARTALCSGSAPHQVKEWSLPTMTVCADTFEIRPPDGSSRSGRQDDDLLLAEVIGERNMLRQFLVQTADSLSDDERATIEARIAELDGRSAA